MCISYPLEHVLLDHFAVPFQPQSFPATPGFRDVWALGSGAVWGAGPGNTKPAGSGNDDTASWVAEYDALAHGRLERVQGAAQQWLTTTTALLGLFSAAIVVGGTNSVSDLSQRGRASVFVAAFLVYAVAFLALVLGALATFGGLGVRRVDAEELNDYIRAEQDRAADAEAYLRALPEGLEPEGVHRELIAVTRQQEALHRRHVALAQARLAHITTAHITSAQSWQKRMAQRWQGIWRGAESSGDAFDYGFRYDQQADKRRSRLHKSRIFGITAAVLSGALALGLLANQTFSPASPPTPSILVVHDRVVTCQTATGLSSLHGVTQVAVVPNC